VTTMPTAVHTSGDAMLNTMLASSMTANRPMLAVDDCSANANNQQNNSEVLQNTTDILEAAARCLLE
jgi:hypothetical protein